MVKQVVVKLGEMVCIAAMVLGGLLVILGGASVPGSLNAGVDSTGANCAGPSEFPAADPNGNEDTSITDALYILNYLFAGGPEPVAPCAAGGDFTPEEVEVLQGLAQYVSIEEIDDPTSDDPDDIYETVRFTGCNVQIVNGLGATNGDPDNICNNGTGTETNGLGNLIVGYNELRNQTPDDDTDVECDGDDYLTDDRTGSHNLVVGTRLNYLGFGGVVFGRTNEVSSAYTTVTGGFENTASVLNAHVSGGCTNTASGPYASVTGGRSNVASASWSVVVGGGEVEAVDGNSATIAYSVVVGGRGNSATAANAVVTGGFDNIASGEGSVVSGGLERTASGETDWVAGDLLEDD